MERTNQLNTTNLPNEVKLLLQLLKIESAGSPHSLDDALIDKIDWKLFVTQAFHHRVYPMLLSKCKLVKEGTIPKAVIQAISSEYKRNTFKMLHLSGEMERVQQLFAQETIRTICLKGPALAYELYGDISLRTSNDLDILIPLKDLQKAEKVLEREGYQKDDYIDSVLNDWKWRHHHMTYYHPQKNTKVEVHWRLSPGPGKEPGFEELWERKMKSTSPHSAVYLLGKEDLFLFLTAHGARHGWSRLRWLMDIKQLVSKDLNWLEVKKRLEKHYMEQVGGQSIILAEELAGTPCTEEMRKIASGNRCRKLAQDAIFYLETMINLHTYPVPEDVSVYHKKHLFSLMSAHQKILYGLSTIHPYADDAKTLPLPVKLHFLYFPLRPFLWAWRKTRSHALP